CMDCNRTFDPGTVTHRCPECNGILDPDYDYEGMTLSRDDMSNSQANSMWTYEPLLPFQRDGAISLAEGQTPLIQCPRLADEYGVGEIYIKDEGRNPTGTFKDRGHTVAVTAATQHGATDIALNTAGNAGQAAAAYAARANIQAHVFVPSRAGFTQKAMTNVHGADMTVVEGTIDDAGASYEDAMADNDWYSTKTFVTPYRHDGKKTMVYEILAQLDWEIPDGIIYPTGGGVGIVGMHKGAKELQKLGLIDSLPRLFAAQASGCAPIVEAYTSGESSHRKWENPDTICGGIEVPDPGASKHVLNALTESGGGAIATSDDEILESGLEISQVEGIEVGATSAAAASGAKKCIKEGTFDENDTIVILSTGCGNKDADILRSHLMSKGM
ncbi:MAG: threonine synthase, partial [Halobacteriaceae archaeon]